MGTVFDTVKTIISIPGWAERSTDKRAVTTGQLASTYKSSVWAYRCINIRSDAAQSVPWAIRRGDESLPASHPAVRVIREVGPEMNWSDLIRATEADLNTYGNAYWLKQRSLAGKVGALLRLNPATVAVESDQRGISAFVQELKGVRTSFERGDVVYFRTYDPTDDLSGMPAMEVAMQAANAGISAATYTAAFFENYAIPPLLMTTEQSIGDAEMSRIKAWWDRWFRGAKRQHRVGIMGSGLKPHVLGYSTKDLALSEVLAEVRRDICAAFGVPPALAGAWEAANYATMQELRKCFWQDTMIPRLDYVAAVLEAELLPEFEPGLEWRWKYGEIEALASDLRDEAERHAVLVQAGIENPGAAATALGVEPASVLPAPPAPSPNGALRTDLDKWQRKAIKRLKDGRSALCEFDSEHIPVPERARIMRGLLAAVNVDEVRAVFKGDETLPIVSNPAESVVLPPPEITEEDVEAALEDWRKRHGDDRWRDVLDAEVISG